MTREEAIKVVRNIYQTDAEKEALGTLIPELAESEEEKIRREIVDFICWAIDRGSITEEQRERSDTWLAYLEKQKESLHIPETCKENVDSFTDEQKVPDCCLKCNEYKIGYKAGYEHGCTAGYNKAMKEVDEQKEQKPLSTEETELNSLAFLSQMGYTCIPPKKEHQNNSDAPKNALGGALNSPLDKDKNLDDIAQDYVEAVKEYNPEPTWDLMQTAVCYGYHYCEQKPISSCDIVPYIDDKIAALQDMWREEKVAFDWDDMHEMIEDVARHFYQKDQKPAEWSEEDEDMRLEAIRVLVSGCERYRKESGCLPGWHKVISWLKSLRPQPNKEIYQAAKHDLAIKFMNYLDENRPDGKMSLSNGECEDIDKAFKENDWTKIIRYYEKYGRRD